MAGIFSSFFINAIQNIGVMEPDMKPVITPTKLELSVVKKIYDIFDRWPKCQISCFCYVFEHLTSTEFL
jgi:hypothetical protein